MTNTTIKRHVGLDILRVLATYMVIQIHTGEFYYIGPNMAVMNTSNAVWVGLYNSLFRMCVPLFVMLSGYFLFPVVNENVFFKKRLSRVVIPFVIWCFLYAFYQYFRGQVYLQTAFINVLKIPINFGTEVGHLWFVYMLIGIYLIAPILSPWVQSASKKSLTFYLILWAISLIIPYVHVYFPEVLGEAFWNKTPMLYYFSGFLGYVVLAVYIKRFLIEAKTIHYVVGVLLIVVGYAITTYGFISRLSTAQFVPALELTWSFETINVAMMAAGTFLLLKDITFVNETSVKAKLLFNISAKSYGIYLLHIMILNAVHGALEGYLESAAVKLPLIASVTFIISYLVIKALSCLPKSKFLVG